MITVENYEIFVDKRTSKNNKTYYGLFIKIGDNEQLLTFINESLYDYINSLSE